MPAKEIFTYCIRNFDITQISSIYTNLQFVRGISREFVCSQTPALPCQSEQSVADTKLKSTQHTTVQIHRLDELLMSCMLCTALWKDTPLRFRGAAASLDCGRGIGPC